MASESDTKQCPFCAETIKAAAVVCRFCTRELPSKPEPVLLVATPVPVEQPAAPAAKEPVSLGVLALVGLGIFLCIALLWSMQPRPGSQARTDTSGGASMAYVMSQSFVKDRLKSPATAKFPSRFEQGVTVTALGSERYRVSAWVDSENSFGALLRTTYQATLRYAGSNNWRLEEMVFGED